MSSNLQDPLPDLVMVAERHADWEVRLSAIVALAPRDDARARSVLVNAIHDPLDSIAFKAIELAGQYRVQEAAKHLMRIVGRPSWFASPGFQGKPVGIGAAIAKQALLQIMGTTDPGQLSVLEETLFPHRTVRQPELGDAVYVPGGAFKAGGRPVFNHFHMDTRDHPPVSVSLPGFWIDRHAVSNQRYRVFLKDVGRSKAFAHPDEPLDKDYTPAYWRRDHRFNGPDLPVVGIDWYDACAFANWSGGTLPSELEWEKAARGTDGRAYPWGTWDDARANDVARAYGRSPQNLPDLDELLRCTNDVYPDGPLLPVEALPEGDSPYGVRQMSGNVWEMTRTNFVSRADMDPFLRGRAPSEFLHRPEALYVIRGGAWTSPPVCLLTWYRCQELVTCRQREIGFRCVYHAPGPGYKEEFERLEDGALNDQKR